MTPHPGAEPYSPAPDLAQDLAGRLPAGSTVLDLRPTDPALAGKIPHRIHRPESGQPMVPPSLGPVAAILLDASQSGEAELLALIKRDRPLLYIDCATETAFRQALHILTGRGYACKDSLPPAATRVFLPGPPRSPDHPPIHPAPSRTRSHPEEELIRLRSALLAAERRLRESQGQVTRLQTHLHALLHSKTYRVGEALREGSGSLRGLAALPLRLAQVLRAAPPQDNRPLLTASGQQGTPEKAPAQELADITEAVFRDGYLPPPLLKTPEGAAAVETLLPAPRRSLRIAGIMDRFTKATFAPEADILELTPGGWESEIHSFKPDFVFVESAWRGKDGAWARKIGQRSPELKGILEWCRQQGVPTAFWNKEDPVHYATFLNTAKLFDAVFTTDIDCIHLYRRTLGHDRVWLLPFACQPRIHNPIETYRRKDAICFAGAYYTRYPERTRDLENFTAGLLALKPLDIFDRNYGKSDLNYAFPDSFQPLIVGSLPPENIDVAYKGYRYAVNLNSVKQSQSMFARRVQELLASNTLTISNYARGLRMMFGDLAIASDDCGEITRRLGQLTTDPHHAGRLRLAALRKTMSEHTVADRLGYIATKIMAEPPAPQALPGVTVFCRTEDPAAAARIIAQFTAQTLPHCHLILSAPAGFTAGTSGNITLAGADSPSPLPEQGWIACWSAHDHYGPNYLYDLVLATRYSDAPLIGKAAFFRKTAALQDQDLAYRPAVALARRRSILRIDALPPADHPSLLEGDPDAVWHGPALAVDPYNYCEAPCDFATIGPAVDDLAGIDMGLPMSEILRRAEAIPPAPTPAQDAKALDARTLAKMFRGATARHIRAAAMGDRFEVMSDLPEGQHEYLYAKRTVRVSDLVQDHALRGYLDITTGLSLSLAILWLDGQGAKIGQDIIEPLRNVSLTPPAAASHARIGLRASGSGGCEIRVLALEHRLESLALVLDRSRTMVLTNNYPDYADLYRNGFLHSRLRRYAAQGLRPSVFRLRDTHKPTFSEFENIDVVTAEGDILDAMLSQPQAYSAVAVHFLMPGMWEVLKRHLDRIEVTVWIHGFEIQPWTRRRFNFTTPEALERGKAESAARMAFWRRLLKAPHPNLKLVFVSQNLAETAMEDLGIRLAPESYAVIHNPIDTGIFHYIPKSAEQRRNVLMIRPFNAPVYATDMAVEAIRILSHRPCFAELNFRIIGDGPLYDETVAPLHGMANVTLRRAFLSHAEIAQEHRWGGIFLVPSRLDSQGVSRDEAMASGLVPVTSRVGAIPEFIDESCGFLAPPEDARGLADAIEQLYHDPDLFLRLSQAASMRVRAQSDAALIIPKEIAVIRRTAGSPAT